MAPSPASAGAPPHGRAVNPTTIRKAVLLAARKGTRRRELTNDLPKPMIAVRGKPILLGVRLRIFTKSNCGIFFVL